MSARVADLARSLEGQPAEAIIRAAAEEFPGRLTFATGLGVEGCVLIDMIGRNRLPVDIFVLDTGVLFPETYDLWKRLESACGVTIRAVRSGQTIEQQAAEHGPELWARDPDKCCDLRKVRSLKAELAKFDAWLSAIRRDQTAERAKAQIFEEDSKYGIVKINPLVEWTSKDVWTYAVKHEVPYNPLHDQGYPSIGCQPCTGPVGEGEDPRAGRWRGKAKTECGIHVTPLTVAR